MKTFKIILTCSIIYSLITFFLTILLISYHNEIEYSQNLYRMNTINNQYSNENLRLYQECTYLPDIKNQTDFRTKIDDNIYSLEEIQSKIKKLSIEIEPGGLSHSIKNNQCKSNLSVAIIIPYRNRLDHLKVFLNNMHPYLTKQKINYGIYVVEQANNDLFNRALLMNIGYLESIKDGNHSQINYDCFIFHDVDFIPEDERNLYKCDQEVPLHFAVAVEQYNYNVSGYWGESYYGGVGALTKNQFEKINGLSNLFFGWGKEDDNLLQRVKLKFGLFKKKPAEIGRYHTLNSEHNRVKPNSRFKIFKDADRAMNKQGIFEGLSTIKYKLLETKKYNLFTMFRVTFNRKTILSDWKKKLKLLNLKKP